MATEEDIFRFLEDECTTQEEKDPHKILILCNGFLEPNPNFDPELLQLKGTSFFLNFDWSCHLHQISGLRGKRIREAIAYSMHHRFIAIFMAQIPKESRQRMSLAAEGLGQILRVAICSKKQKRFNNGEVYLWLPHIQLAENFVFTILSGLKKSTDENPIKIDIGERDFDVKFCGWGFRQV